MPSLEGLKTWFDYELLIVALGVTLVIVAWVGHRIVEYLGTLPLTSPAFALAFTAVCLVTFLLLLWLAGRYG